MHSPKTGLPALAADEIPSLPPEWLSLVDSIFEGKTTAGEIDIPTAVATAETYMQAVVEGYGKNFEAIDYDTPDYNALANLERNVYQFAGAKNYQTLKELTLLLKDGDKIRTYEDFRAEASKMLHEWNDVYGRAEYNTAVASAQMAGKWQDFKEAAATGDEVLLEYSTVGDQRVRREHQELDGTIKPLNDAFWEQYYPPNGWNCRCNVIRNVTAAETPGTPATPENVPKMFRVNLAERQMAFPPGHPFYKGCPKEVLEEMLGHIPFERRFQTVAEYSNGGRLQVHLNYNPKEDKKYLIEIAMEKAKQGHHVQLLPEIHAKEKALRKIMYPDAKGNKNPDLRIDGELVEVKRPEKLENIVANINKAYSQANHVIIELAQKPDPGKLKHIADKVFYHPDANIRKEDLHTLEFRYATRVGTGRRGKWFSFNKDKEKGQQ